MASEYEKKLVEMQYQLKENQLYMEDCFKDLDSWTQDMKEKEKKILENPESAKISSKVLPPIRALAEKKKKKKKILKPKETGDNKENGAQTTNNKSTKKLHSYDYRAWDKLDVDKLCEEVDKEKSASSSDYTTDEEWEEEQRKTRASWEKERGNQFFKDNLLDEAITCYTKSIELDPLNAIYPANRAMCLIKQERYAAAIVDCNLSISLDSKYSKAYHRRATALIKLGKLEEAKRDYEELLKLEPSSKLAQVELNKLEQMIDSRQLVFPVIKSEEQRSKKPLRRIEIQEINDDSQDKKEVERNLKEINKRINLTEKDEKFFKIDQNEKLTGNKIVEVEEKMEKINLVENKIVEQTTIDATETKTAAIKAKKETSDEKKTQMAASNTNVSRKKVPDVPTNSFQFKKDWQYLSNDFELLCEYFKKIDPNMYTKLFLNGLESDYLSKMLKIYNTQFKNDPSKDLVLHLKCLIQVKRFQTQLMFLDASDKQNIQEILNHLKTIENESNKKDIQNIHEMFVS